MAEVKILVKGYVYEQDGKMFGSSTVVLIKDNGKNIIVDPGMNRKLLTNALLTESLKIDDIDYVVLTHYHLDHSLLSSIFENAKILDNSIIYSFDSSMQEHVGKIPDTDVKIMNTPGHDQFHCAIIAETLDFGTVAMAGDVFWWTDEQEKKTDKQSLINLKDPYVKDPVALRKSREKLLETANYIISGHGPMFKVEE
ncbi:MBL fold metallo-hydrolase [Candidatus Micrarchaeota archaeon]|nr:MBL fold metallo-hydrolase [Candidatus Micrarchaeota archaeon]